MSYQFIFYQDIQKVFGETLTYFHQHAMLCNVLNYSIFLNLEYLLPENVFWCHYGRTVVLKLRFKDFS